MYFFFEVSNGVSEFVKSKRFIVNKKKLLRYSIITLTFFAVDFYFFDKTIAWLGILFGLGLVVFIQIIVLIPMEIALKIQSAKIIKDRIINMKIISSVTSSGFTIQFHKGSISYDWNEIKSLKLKNMELTIAFFSKKRKLTITDNDDNYYYLLKNIPKGYPTIDYAFLEDFFNSLTTCPFCGLVAFHKDYCLACYSKDWNEELAKKYPSKEEYIRENQLELFAATDEETISTLKIDCNPFVRDEKWKPLVTKQEVFEYYEYYQKAFLGEN